MKTIVKHSITLLIGLVGSSAWAACVTQPAPNNSIVANAAGDMCTNNVNISTTVTGLAGFGMSDTPLGVAVNSVTLINSSSGTITTTGHGATGIHSEGVNAIIINNGSINVSGGSSSSYYADGINALGNNSTVTNNGSIVASGYGMIGVWFQSTTGGSFNNSGSIVASGSVGAGVTTGLSMVNFVNSGSVTASGTNSFGVVSVAVENFTNTGSISGAGAGINSNGAISILNNAQGGNTSSPSTTALTYLGAVPTNYNIIINSSSHYGQLAVTSPVGRIINFGIYGTPLITSRAYSSVLSGTALPSGTSSGTYDNMTWSLVENGGAIDLVFTGASRIFTQQSLELSAQRLKGIYNLQSTAVVNGLTYDCRLFDVNNICLSTGGRYSDNHGASGYTRSALLIGAYRLNKNVRLGAWVDQNLSTNTVTGINLSNSKPLFGLFGAWAENPSGEGYEVKVSAAYGDKDLTVTRDVIGTSEAGFGGTRLNSQAISTVSSYGFKLNNEVLASPYVGVQYSRISSGGYTETTTADVTTPLIYGRLSQENVSILAGLKLFARLDPKTALFGSVGVEQNINNRGGQYSATGVDGLTAVNFNSNVEKTRATASAGVSYDIDKKQRVSLSGIYREEAFSPTATTSIFATYTVGL